MRLLIIGPPGAGKGTQAERIAARLRIAHVSTGDMFRAQTGEIGELVAEIMQRGDYVPDEITIEMLRARLSEPDAAAGFLLDGFPRTHGQAEALDELLGPQGLDAVVLLEVPENQLVERLKARGRPDDSEDAIRTRLQVYREQTEPLVDFYRQRGLVRTVVGTGDIEEIGQRIIEAVTS